MSVSPMIRRAARRATSRLRGLPDFVVIGTMRAATTSLFDLMADHPDIATSSRKEVHYADLHADRGEQWYRAFFPVRRRGVRVGEATPAYLAHPAAPANLAAVTPDAKLIVVLRDPVARAISHHAYRVGLGYERRSLADAVADELSLEADGIQTLSAGIARVQDMPYLASGRYAEQLERWFEHFERDQFLVLDYADVTGAADGLVQDVWSFLGVGETTQRLPRVNASSGAAADDALVQRLRGSFAPWDQRLSELLGRRFSWMATEPTIDLRTSAADPTAIGTRSAQS